MDPLLVVVLVLLVAFIEYIAYKSDSNAINQAKDWAEANRFHYLNRKIRIRKMEIPEGMEWIQRYDPFTRSMNGFAEHLTVGTFKDIQFTLFTYRIPNSESPDPLYAVVYAQCPRTLPRIDIYISGVFKRWWANVVKDTVVLGDPEFDRRYRIYAEDHDQARVFLTSSMRRSIDSSGFSSVVINANEVVMTASGKLTTEMCNRAMKLAHEINARAA